MRIALVHYSISPVIGGVERVLDQLAGLLQQEGHEVVLVAANSGDGRFPSLQIDWSEAALRNAFSNCDWVIVHNMFSMPFHAEAAQTLARLSHEYSMLNWMHDLDVSAEWFEQLRLRARHVTISQTRAKQIQTVLGLEDLTVIPNGVDWAELQHWSPRMRDWAVQGKWLEQEVCLFHPARILPRKNLEWSLRFTSALLHRGIKVRCLISGAPDPYRSSSREYVQGILALREALHLQEAVQFLGAEQAMTNAEVMECYRAADAVLFPSLSEGFGLPLLEAAIYGTPIFASNLAVHQEISTPLVHLFDTAESMDHLAQRLHNILLACPRWQAKRQVLQRFSWSNLYQQRLLPLLNV